MKSVWLPILPELSAANSHEIMQGRTVVLAILDRTKEEQFERAKKELKAAALEWMDVRASEEKAEKQEQRNRKELKIEEAEDKGDQRALKAAKGIHIVSTPKKDVGFGWVDGVFWERWLRGTYGIDVREMGMRVIINEEDAKRYWDTTIENKPIEPSRSQVLETLQTVLQNPTKIKSKSTSTRFENVIYAARDVGEGHPIASGGFMLGVILALAWWWRGRMRSAKGGPRRVSLNLGGGSSNGGLLSNGKFD